MTTTLVIARYAEKLDWLLQIPDDVRIVVYNKGEAITGAEILGRVDCIEARRNFGRESETYLHHLLTAAPGDDGFSIFCQGDPFSHSPDFLTLLEHRAEWADVQALTDRWQGSLQIPPEKVLVRETMERIAGLRVRSELFSLHTWNPVRFVDDGALRIGRDYLSGRGQLQGTNIAAHFLATAGWPELEEQAAAADFGQYAYGAIFAVRNELLLRIPEDVLGRLHLMSRSHPLYPWILERLWLHFFGLPFHPAIQRHSGNVLPQRLATRTSLPVEAGAPSA